MGRGSTKIVGLSAFSLHGGEIESAHGVIYVEECPAGFEVPNFDDRGLQALLDPDQLPYKIRRGVTGFAGASGVEEADDHRRNVVIQKILTRQQSRQTLLIPYGCKGLRCCSSVTGIADAGTFPYSALETRRHNHRAALHMTCCLKQV